MELTHMFKRAWMYPNEPLCVPCTERHGKGMNFLPCIHVDDLSVLARRLASTAAPPVEGSEPLRSQYVVATDGVHVTLTDICTAVSSALANGKVRLPAWEEVDDLALEDVHAAALQSNLRFHKGLGDELRSDLQGGGGVTTCPNGFVAHVREVAQEYVKAEQLRPRRLLVIAPPGLDLGSFEAQASSQLHLPSVNLHTCCEYLHGLAKELKAALKVELEARGQALPEEPGKGGGKAKGKGPTWASLASNEADAELLSLHEEVGSDSTTFKPEVLTKVVKMYLRRQECRNHGYVLTLAPNFANWAENLFGMENAGVSEESSPAETFDSTMCPNVVLVFDSEDDKLRMAATAAASHKQPEMVTLTLTPHPHPRPRPHPHPHSCSHPHPRTRRLSRPLKKTSRSNCKPFETCMVDQGWMGGTRR
jgi:hypothetical protein